MSKIIFNYIHWFFSIFFIGENGGFIWKNWLLLLSAALSIEQTLVGMTNALVALYNLKKPPPKIEEQKEAEEMQLPETPLTLKQH